jgi:proliferating cell nuclear antigen
MQVQIENADDMKRIFDAMKEVVKEVNLNISSGGMECSAMDSSHVAFCKLTIPSTSCTYYKTEGDYVIGLHIPTLCKFLASCDKEDAVELKYSPDNQDILEIKFVSRDLKRQSNFNYKLLHIDSEELNVPEIQFAALITLPYSMLNGIIKNLLLIGDTVNITLNEEGVTFSVPNSDIGSGGTTLVDSDDVKIERNEACSLTFSLRYFHMFTKSNITQGNASIGIKNETPMMLECHAGGTGIMRYYMAPKVDE